MGAVAGGGAVSAGTRVAEGRRVGSDAQVGQGVFVGAGLSCLRSEPPRSLPLDELLGAVADGA
jgi:hypothetical protein